ncbi:MAG: outer membrane beta-barrel protein [Opitutus sp.]|nr:outer membrane beta-barrel protein [Opitutus sp.]MCS6247641.1 outer membrane beta-barrel protein [Opitutus sp.]MCS6274198.1 outer membrane beta-barrel protein [Opitutus sp.]MCS6276832.1 outer membrane beta-barrel protein [Opitutus sp.]MCS6301519.1 outer membrane beta-barrel protein [Opitutus sp.]
MIKHLSKISGLAAFAALAVSASAEVKLNENFSVDGYATAAARVTEGTAGDNQAQIENLGRTDNSAKIALNGNYDAFTAKVSALLLNGDQAPDLNGRTGHNFGLLDAYVSYTKDEFVVTGGKYLGWLGYESFDSPNNAFISFSAAGNTYVSPYATGAKVEYIAKAFSTGVSVRDTQFVDLQNSKYEFFKGDDNFGKELGYEAYFLYTGVEKLKVWAGMGTQNVRGYAGDGSSESLNTYDVWVSYELTPKLTLVAEYASFEDVVDYSWNVMANYAFTADFSGAVRVTGSEGFQDDNDTFGYGVASTYVLHKNFSLKAEVTKTENNLVDTSDVFSYALQGVLRF